LRPQLHVDSQDAVGQRRTDDLDVVGEAEAALESARRDAAIKVRRAGKLMEARTSFSAWSIRRTSRRPWPLPPTAMIAASETMRPSWRAFT
jgi:hypothetical protein